MYAQHFYSVEIVVRAADTRRAALTRRCVVASATHLLW
jgi:hypothetical protein